MECEEAIKIVLRSLGDDLRWDINHLKLYVDECPNPAWKDHLTKLINNLEDVLKQHIEEESVWPKSEETVEYS